MRSMTGFASRQGQLPMRGTHHGDEPPLPLEMELRAVNGRTLDLRLRLPDTLAALEPMLRAALGARVARGNVTLTLRIATVGNDTALRLDPVALDSALDAMIRVDAAARARGLEPAAFSAADLLGVRGVLVPARSDSSPDIRALTEALLPEVEALIDAFDAHRLSEGAALAELLSAQINRIAALTAQARALLPARAQAQADALGAALQRLNAAPTEPERMAQELALLAVKGDVSEELDRLDAHCAAARALLQSDTPIGRKLDFLSQEFNREANTLCSKAQHPGLTRIGLDLKAVIDQMREQIQNVE